MRVTQIHIAQLAKVSQATVSRVISGDTRVEADAKARVLKAMREHNYRPDVRAQALRTRRTGMIGLVIQRPNPRLAADPFFSSLVTALMGELSSRSSHLCIDMVKDETAQGAIYDELLRTRRVDGLILVEPRHEDPRVHLLQEDRFPFVVIGNPRNPLIASVDNDNVFAGYMAAQHLIQQGYTQVGFVGGAPGLAVSDERIDGYRKAIEEAGLEPIVWHSSFGLDESRASALSIFEKNPKIEALVVLDDMMALGFVSAAKQKDIRLGDDLALVSFNDSYLCHLVEGGLTSVTLNIEQLVSRAVSKLMTIIEGGELASVREIVGCEIVVRGTSRKGEVPLWS